MPKGIAASPGIAIGRVFRVEPDPSLAAAEPNLTADPAADLAAFQQAVEASRRELASLRDVTAQRLGEAEAQVFDAHALMLEDPALVDAVTAAIEGGTGASTAVRQVAAELADMLRGLDDEYMKERAADVEDVGRRLLRHILGAPDSGLSGLTEPRVVVAQDLTPSDTAQMDPSLVLGFATEKGGRTSHTAIMARTLGIPAVVGAEGLLDAVPDGATVVLDGEGGLVLVNPDEGTLEQYRARATAWAAEKATLEGLRDLPALTADGHRVELAANAAGPRDVEPALAAGAEGVGLYRTEFLFMDRTSMPTEEEQYQAYKAVVEGMGGRPVIIRTLDVGGDKHIPYLSMEQEENPFLGWRAIRMCLDRADLFKVQLRALWRAGNHGTLLVMFPMVATLEEVRQAKALLDEARRELVAAGMTVPASLPVGIMIEVPSAALIADQLAREVDFFSIGSNDLVQYTMATDRMNQRISGLYQPLHPGVLALVARVIEAAHRHGKWAGMCGEMAGDPACIPVLLGLGLDEFSMSAGSIPQAKRLVRSLSRERCQELARQALEAGTASEVAALVAELIRQ